MSASPSPLAQSTVDDLWDFDDPAGSAQRFADAQARATDPGHRAELVTQQARALGLQGDVAAANSLLDDVQPITAAVDVRVLLERGRLLNSSGDPAAAVPLFLEAAERAQSNGLDFLAVDAWHMLAIAEPTAAAAHTTRALELVDATKDPRNRRWRISLHNNLGWTLHDEGRYDEALAEFEAAHAASLDVGTPEQEYVARWAIARCLRSLGDNATALTMQRQLAAEDPEDDYVTEEIDALETALGGS